MQVNFSPPFRRAFKKLIKGRADLEARFLEKLQKFLEDPFDSSLRTHKLSGKLNDYWSFSVAYDVRVLFYFEDDEKAVFVNIGSHDDVY